MPAAHAALARSLLHAVRAQGFEHTADAQQGGAPVQHFPSIDLAVAAFVPGAAPRWANVLFSREHPHGLAAEFAGPAGAVTKLRFDADVQDAQGESIAWQPGADWSRIAWQPLQRDHAEHGGQAAQQRGGLRFVAPYPASLLKLMVAVGVGLAVDRGLCAWPAALLPMIAVSDNDATTELVALLHRLEMVGPLNRRLAAAGLRTLQLNGTRPGGGWRNADGSGVGHIHMTAWDTVRLLWLLDADAPPPPWLPAAGAEAGARLLQPATRERLREALQGQQLDEILSSGALKGVPGWLPGLPDAPAFAHKTGTTENYASDAGIVCTDRTHYIVAVLTNLGRRYAPQPRCATTWRLPALGAAVHRAVQELR